MYNTSVHSCNGSLLGQDISKVIYQLAQIKSTQTYLQFSHQVCQNIFVILPTFDTLIRRSGHYNA